MYRNEQDIITYDQYFNELIITGTYAGHYEIINASLLLNVNFIIYRNQNFSENNNYNNIFTFETIINKYDSQLNPFIPIIILAWVNNNHFILLN